MSKLKKNLMLNITYQILILFLPLVTSSYLARIVGADGIGRYSYSYSIALYFTYFTLLGLQKYGNRIIASVQEDKLARSKYFCEIYVMQIMCFLACVIVYIVYATAIADDRTVALIQTIFVCSALFDVNWFFFGMEMFDKTVIRNTIVKIATTVLIFLLVKQADDVEKYVLIMAVGYLGSQLALWPYLRRYISFVKVRWTDVKKHILPNLTLFIPVIAVSVYKIMDKIMLGMMSAKSVVGLYENAEKIITVPVAVVTALGTVMLPRVTALVAAHKDQEVFHFRDTAVSIITAFTVASCFGILAVGDLLAVWMWGEEFLISGTVMKYLAVTLIFLGIGNVIRTQFLIPYKYDRVYVISAVLGAVVNVGINALLIPHLEAVGAAIGTICAEAVVCLYQLFMVRKHLPLVKYVQNTMLFCVVGVIMFLVIQLIPVIGSNFTTLIIRIAVGVLVYGLLAAPLVINKVISHFRRN